MTAVLSESLIMSLVLPPSALNMLGSSVVASDGYGLGIFLRRSRGYDRVVGSVEVTRFFVVNYSAVHQNLSHGMWN